jgi:hypothetical protein
LYFWLYKYKKKAIMANAKNMMRGNGMGLNLQGIVIHKGGQSPEPLIKGDVAYELTSRYSDKFVFQQKGVGD